MRLQLIHSMIALFVLIQPVLAQEEEQPTDINMNFLFSYYEQDGDHSAVTGGEGSQRLKDIASVFLVNVPIDSTRSYTLDLGINYYTSASSDRIDFNMSSPSRHEWRVDFEFIYNWEKLPGDRTMGFSVGQSRDNDYQSISVGYYWAKDYNESNSQWLIKGKIFFDHWFHLFYPKELRDTTWVDTEHRNSFSIFNQYSKVINKKTVFAINSELVYQYGLLSTPFYRVYFDGGGSPFERTRVERLPIDRFKTPTSIRLNHYLNDRMILRFFYRFYFDTWGIYSSTVSLETPIKINPYLTVTPILRYYTQSGTRYFAPRGGHEMDAEFYTSDYDLSSFDSYKFGMGLKYSPLSGILRMKQQKRDRYTLLKSINIRAARYLRSDGLEYNIITGDFNFVF